MRFLAAIGALAILAAIACGFYVFGGYFDVAAAPDDPAIVQWALTRVREASIDRHAGDRPAIKLDDPTAIQNGARHFAQAGCANCHGAPGVEWAKFSEGLNPAPPDLKEAAGDEPAHIFWVVKNGIKMTAMPSFGKIGVADNDIWQIVAFIKKLPNVSSDDYKAWTAANPAAMPSPAKP